MTTHPALRIIAVIADDCLRQVLEAAFARYLPEQWRIESSPATAIAALNGADDRTMLLCDDSAQSPASAFLEALAAARPDFMARLIVIGQSDTPQPPDPRIAARAFFPLPLRLGALLARLEEPPAPDPHQPVALGPYTLYPADAVLTRGAGTDIEKLSLTEKERDILLKLWETPGAIVTRQVLLDDVWGYAAGVETHTLETHIYRLRQKLEADPAAPQWLITADDGYALKKI